MFVHVCKLRSRPYGKCQVPVNVRSQDEVRPGRMHLHARYPVHAKAISLALHDCGKGILIASQEECLAQDWDYAVVSCATGTLSLGMRCIESVCNKADALISLTPMGTCLPAPKLAGDMIGKSSSHGYSIFNVLPVQGASRGCLRHTRGSLSVACHGSIVLALFGPPLVCMDARHGPLAAL